MGKKTKVQKNQECKNHKLIMKPMYNSCKYQNQIQIDYCQFNLSKKYFINLKKNHKIINHPVFNKDKNYATNSFILPYQKNYYFNNHQTFKKHHDQEINNYKQQKSIIEIPKPSSKTQTCSVCKFVYDDYLKHIESNIHKISIQNSAYNQHILDLVDFFHQVKDDYKIDKVNHPKNTRNINQKKEWISSLQSQKLEYNKIGSSLSTGNQQLISKPFQTINHDEKINQQKEATEYQNQALTHSQNIKNFVNSLININYALMQMQINSYYKNVFQNMIPLPPHLQTKQQQHLYQIYLNQLPFRNIYTGEFINPLKNLIDLQNQQNMIQKGCQTDNLIQKQQIDF